MTTLEREVNELKRRVAQLETTVGQLLQRVPRESLPLVEIKASTPSAEVSREDLRAWLKAEGILVDLPPEALAHARAWEELPEEEKQAVRWELDHLPPGPMASDIIIENRR